LTWSGEQESATDGQDGRDLGDQPALYFRVQQEEKAPGDHAIKSSTEEV
jgi:hypothetical protein